jgi:asparagine synthetase B (glutamine-hydrolysing)
MCVTAAPCLIHRGPDQQGTFRSDAVSLGAVRLRVIDIEGGDQPITSEDGDTTSSSTVKIYNYAELRDELVALGHRFRTHCDTEVLLEPSASGISTALIVAGHVRGGAVVRIAQTPGAGS